MRVEGALAIEATFLGKSGFARLVSLDANWCNSFQ
jgi:hypothetical protein